MGEDKEVGCEFTALTPIDNVQEGMEIYSQALNYALKNEDILNIAITGIYGAGKSSVIRTFEKKYLEKNEKSFLYISLANLGERDEKDDYEIENKLANQLIYQMKEEVLANTNFNVKSKVNTKKVKMTAASICIYILCTLFLIVRTNSVLDRIEWLLNGMYKGIISQREGMFYISSNYIILLVPIMFLTYTSYKLLVYTIKLQKYKKIFRIIKVKGSEIVLDTKNNTNVSFFDQHLNDLIYLFANSESKVFVFQDIDRFNNNNIFVKLREINFLLNISGKNIIKFIYVIKDEMFDTLDRTKFFDFMIPIVPKITSVNSLDLIRNELGTGIANKIDNQFIVGISLYICDMRLLKNIKNEFYIYNNCLKENNLNETKLLSLIIYKNLNPTDFSDLQNNTGILYQCIKKDRKEIKINSYQDPNLNAMVGFMLYHKYIESDYKNYLSHFVEGVITKEDYKFIQSIHAGTTLKYDFPIGNIKNLIELGYLYEVDFSKLSILNIKLLDFLCKLENRTQYHKYIERVIILLKNKKQYKFTLEYLKNGEYNSKAYFINLLNNYWETFVQDITRTLQYNENFELVCLSYIESLYDEFYDTLDKGSKSLLREFIGNESMFLHTYSLSHGEQTLECILARLKKLDVKFKYIQLKGLDSITANYLIEQGLYVMTYKNIETIILYKTQQELLSKQLLMSPFNTINDYTGERTKKNVLANINEFLNEYFKENSTEIYDGYESVKIVIQNKYITEENLNQYSHQLVNCVEDIRLINKEDKWKYLLKKGNKEWYIFNLYTYYNVKGLDQYLKEAINHLELKQLKSYTPIRKNVEDQAETIKINDFYNEIVNWNDLKIEIYHFMVNMCEGESIHVQSKLPDNKLQPLIENNKLAMSLVNLRILKERGEEPLKIFVQNKIVEFMELDGEKKFKIVDVQAFLHYSINSQEKIHSLKGYSGPISIRVDDIDDELLLYIIENNVDRSEKIVLYKNYLSYSNNIRTKIYKEFTIDTNVDLEDIHPHLLAQYFKDDNINEKNKMIYLSVIVDENNHKKMKKSFTDLGVKELISIFEKRKQRNYPKKEKYLYVINLLTQKGIIHSYEEREKDIQITRWR